MIEVQDLTKSFGPVQAVDHISFQVNKDEIVGFLGPNGAGKTTTMRILTTYLPATSGIARVAGHDVMTESMAVRRKIGYLPESVPLYGEMRVEEYLDFRAKIKGVERKQRPGRVEHCLERARLRGVRRRLIGTLSKGYRQRVGLADAMVQDPPILILDEPTAGLDPLQIRETLTLIKELGQGHTILLSTHILSEVETICQRVIIITSGRLGFSKSLAELESQAVILVEARAPADQVAAAARAVDGVTQVITHGAPAERVCSLEIHTRDNCDLREAISQQITSKGWILRRLERRRRKLDDAYFDVLRAQDPLKGDRDSQAVQDLSRK
jgi:ABC-2 type transport system ATP-binding protein